jgi:superfamily II DNA or RNA helicase
MFIDNFYDIELNENSKLAIQSPKIKIKLKPHQLAALNKAIDMENKGKIRYKIDNTEILSSYSNINTNNIIDISTNVGIFGDIVGYGKTFIALSLIAINDINNIHINNNLTEIYNNTKNYNYFSISTTNNLISMNIIKSTLIIVPRGPVYAQWENMIRKNTSLRILAINNLVFIKTQLPKYNGNNMNEIINFYNSYDIVLIKNTTLSLFFNYYYHDNINIISNWKRVIIDEAHDIINNLRININYHYLWLISATYEKIVDKIRKSSNNSLIVSKDVMTHYINFMTVKNNIKFIKNSFQLPEPIEKFYLCKLSNNINIIKNFISGSILEKLNANDISGAIKELGGKNETEEEIIELVSKELKRELHNKEMERNYIINLDISQEQKTLKLKNINNDIENQEEKIKNLTERISYISSKTCSICMELITNPIMIECTHIFCGSCLIRWLNTGNNCCPNCRVCINSPNKLIAIVDSNNDNNEIKEEILSKEETLLKIINSKKNGRYLIFSKNENSFESIKSILLKTSYNYELLKGNTSHMINILNKFKKGELNIILLNTQYAGSGIDISDATDIIIFHNMGIDKQQAIGRAQRVGRTTELYIHNLCYEHEL